MTVTDIDKYVDELLARAMKAATSLAQASTEVKNRALLDAAEKMLNSRDMLSEANEKDIEAAQKSGLSEAMVDRLRLTDQRIGEMAEGLRNVASLRDPVGEVMTGWTLPNELRIQKIRTPIGVIGIIFESRPNVTADAAALCVKSGNAVILRGGKEAINSNLAIHKLLAEAFEGAGLDRNCAQLVETTDRAAIDVLLAAEGRLDLVIPRGGEGLIRAVVEKAKVPVIKHYKGVCHVFVDKSADHEMAEKIVLNAKVQRPSVCNAMETLLVHREAAKDILPRLLDSLAGEGCELRGCERSIKLYPNMKPATEEDWYEEYNELILSVKVVDSLEEAISHINKYGSKHSDAIVTEELRSAERFSAEVDSCGVFVNCSTRFNDGGQFGMGAEIGISTDKLHARGPMALPELTSYKYIVSGCGQIRE